VLLVGSVLAAALIAVGAPFFVRAVETDLTARATAELDRQGVSGAVVSFDGQSGRVDCAGPLDDPEAVVAALVALRGVDVIELDRGCRVNRAPDVRPEVAAPTAPSTTTVTVGGDPTESDPPAFESVADVLRDDPRFSVLAVLVRESEVLDGAIVTGPVTILAPTDEAFDEMPADLLAQLRRDPEALTRLLGHHLVPRALVADDLRSGPLITEAGTTLTVERRGALVRVDDATVIGRDLVAGDGVVHAIDTVLLPDALLASPAEPVLTVAVEGGRFALSGAVPSAEERCALVVATHAAAHPDLVADDLTVVDDGGPATEVLGTLRALVAELPRLLVSGRVEVLDRNGMEDAIVAVRVTGIHVDEAARARLEELLASTMALVETEPRATADDAAVLDVQRRVAALLVDRPLVFAPGATIPEDGEVVLDLIAAALRRVDGLAVTVVGHTDSTGDPAANLALSETRAEAVREELVIRGLPASTLRVVGRGGTEPVRVDGVEDVEASRRIEFVVRLATSG
jgi:outer membrane protein OmpA-like peptidoglycan-associated protein/uncharacterized surface protein with fasciclin (FAS1) repeats